MTYNALDNIDEAKKLREQLILEQQDLASSLSYEYATSWCSDCPNHERARDYAAHEFGVRYAPTCCKDDEQWAEDHESEFQKQTDIESLIQAISKYLGSEDHA